MNIKITEKELKVTEAIKEYCEKKLERLVKYFGEDFDVTVTLSKSGFESVAAMKVVVNGEIYKAETAHKDLYAAIDKDIDVLEGQVRKMKTKKDKQNMTDSIRVLEDMDVKRKELENEILKTIYYDIKPMTTEDAKLKLEEKNQDIFLVFVNVETNKVNVIYKLKDNKNFGIVEPEA